MNLKHLFYFWKVAKLGSVVRAAEAINVTPQTLSGQIGLLEESFGTALFSRQGRALVLTEAGQLALSYAESIFTSGTELMALLRDGRRLEREVMRIGAVATLSRNFQENFLSPLLARADVELVLQSGSLTELLARLRVHTVDIVLSNQRVHSSADDPWRCRRIARQPISLVGPKRKGRRAFRFPQDLASVPLLLPGQGSDIRAGFDLLCDQLGIRYTLRAEVDDMALLRLLARDSGGVALLPTVVVQDELQSGALVEYAVVPDLQESFYAITVQRHFEPPWLKALLKRPEAEVLRRG